MRSLQSLQECFVCFENTTERTLNVIWLDYHGKERFHNSMQPHGKAKINTFRTHPWIFCDHETGEQMHAWCSEEELVRQQELSEKREVSKIDKYKMRNHPIYLPMPCYVRNPQSPTNLIPARQRVSIHFPLRTLRENCLWQVLRTLRATTIPGTITRRSIDSLDIPGNLKKDLQLLLETIETYKRNFAPIVLFRL